MKAPHTYRVLRYVHDVTTGEYLNIGVVLYAPAMRQLAAKLQTKAGRLKKAFPAIQSDVHNSVISYLQARFDRINEQYLNELAIAQLPESLKEITEIVVPNDDSSLQWGPIKSGLTSDPQAEVLHLFSRLVSLHDTKTGPEGRGDGEVWNIVSEPLRRRRLLKYLTKHVVTSEDDSFTFDHAWKNHSWHCIQPLSLDLLKPSRIIAKAHELVGQMTGVQEKILNHNIYVIVGEPSLEKCKVAASRASNIIAKRLPAHTEIVKESEVDAFSAYFAEKVRTQLAESGESA